MKVPTQYELTHLQLQAMLREHNVPETELKYIGERVYPEHFKGHPEFHGMLMHWYLIAGEHEVPVCDIGSVDCVDD
jgi:hypothetical protein